MDRGDREHRRVERHRAEELADDDLHVGQRRGEQQLDRSRSLLLRVNAHRHQRQHEQQDDARVEKERPYQLRVDVGVAALEPAELQALLVEDDQHHVIEPAPQQREHADDDVADRRREVPLQLLLRYREDVAHGTTSSAAAACGSSSVVTCRKISSRLIRIGRISSSPHPRLTTAAASSRRTSRPVSLSTS